MGFGIASLFTWETSANVPQILNLLLYEIRPVSNLPTALLLLVGVTRVWLGHVGASLQIRRGPDVDPASLMYPSTESRQSIVWARKRVVDVEVSIRMSMSLCGYLNVSARCEFPFKRLSCYRPSPSLCQCRLEDILWLIKRKYYLQRAQLSS